MCILEPSAQTSPYRDALTSPSLPGPETLLDKHLLSAPAHREPPPGPCRSSHLPLPFPPVWNLGSQLPRLRHGIGRLLPSTWSHPFPRCRLLIGGSVGHSAIPHVAPPTGRAQAPPPRLFTPLNCPAASAEKFWSKSWELAANSQRQQAGPGKGSPERGGQRAARVPALQSVRESRSPPQSPAAGAGTVS